MFSVLGLAVMFGMFGFSQNILPEYSAKGIDWLCNGQDVWKGEMEFKGKAELKERVEFKERVKFKGRVEFKEKVKWKEKMG